MSERFFECFCLNCRVTYVEDVIDNVGTCRECGSEQLEWEGFTA